MHVKKMCVFSGGLRLSEGTRAGPRLSGGARAGPLWAQVMREVTRHGTTWVAMAPFEKISKRNVCPCEQKEKISTQFWMS